MHPKKIKDTVASASDKARQITKFVLYSLEYSEVFSLIDSIFEPTIYMLNLDFLLFIIIKILTKMKKEVC